MQTRPRCSRNRRFVVNGLRSRSNAHDLRACTSSSRPHVRGLQRPHRGVLRRRVAVPPLSGGALPEVHRAACRSGWATCRVSFNLDGDESIWIHAVSVGEVLTARALLPQLRERYPRLRLFVSTTTMTGQQVARTNLPVRRRGVLLSASTSASSSSARCGWCKPRLFIMMETEIWPNLLRACQRAGVKTALVNGRISTRSYPRYRLARPSSAACSPTSIASACRARSRRAASSRSARRASASSSPARSSSIRSRSRPGDGPRRPPPIAAATACCAISACRPSGPVVIAASTLKGEEEPVLEAFQRIRATMTQRAAHHRAAQARAVRRGRAAGAARAGWNVARRTELRVDAEPRNDVVILDTIGELAQLFQVATVVFVGGSLVDAGGHNILEPAVFGKPIVFGPHMQNFAEIARTFLDNGARRPGALGARARDRAARAARRSGAARQPRRGRAGAGRSQSRRARQEPRRASPSCCRRDGTGNVRPFRVSEMR